MQTFEVNCKSVNRKPDFSSNLAVSDTRVAEQLQILPLHPKKTAYGAYGYFLLRRDLS